MIAIIILNDSIKLILPSNTSQGHTGKYCTILAKICTPGVFPTRAAEI